MNIFCGRFYLGDISVKSIKVKVTNPRGDCVGAESSSTSQRCNEVSKSRASFEHSRLIVCIVINKNMKLWSLDCECCSWAHMLKLLQFIKR